MLFIINGSLSARIHRSLIKTNYIRSCIFSFLFFFPSFLLIFWSNRKRDTKQTKSAFFLSIRIVTIDTSLYVCSRNEYRYEKEIREESESKNCEIGIIFYWMIQMSLRKIIFWRCSRDGADHQFSFPYFFHYIFSTCVLHLFNCDIFEMVLISYFLFYLLP